MDYEEYKEERKTKWLDKNSGKSQLLSNNIISMNPEVGYYIKVEGIEISTDFFPEEFEQITTAYNSVIKKLDEHYKNKSKSGSQNILNDPSNFT